MLNNNKKQHAECPTCKSAISFNTSVLESDFAHLHSHKYKYFGSVSDPNLTCPYCSSVLKRGDIVTIFRFADEIVYRGPIVAGHIDTGGGDFAGRDLTR